MENRISFFQERDFGGIINATFTFIRQEIKPLGKMLLVYYLPLLVVLTALSCFIQLNGVIEVNSLFNKTVSLSAYFITQFILTLFLLSYITVYIKNPNSQITINDVLSIAKEKWHILLAVNLLYGIIIVVGFVLLIIPGIYLSILLMFMPYSLFIENRPFKDLFSRSAEVCKENWWFSFSISLVILLILMAMIGVIYAVIGGIMGVYIVHNYGYTESILKISIIVDSFGNILRVITSSIMLTAGAFLFGSLVKRNEDPELEALVKKMTQEDNA
jgi:hypothetical protein